DPTGRDADANGKLEPNPKRSFAARRTAQLHNWMVAAPWWQFIFLPLAVLVLGALRVLWRIITKEPKLAAGELKSTLVTVFRPFAAWQSRLRRARQSKISPRTLRPLQAKSSQIRQAKTTARRVAKDQRRP
ncbi:glycosyltransferase family 2 protein, partial [Mobiluncus curtisii]|nr:glycosyltransferase family 2 protein [Mobiluncus curtisii]